MKTANEIIRELIDYQCNPEKFTVLQALDLLNDAKTYLATGGWLDINNAPKDGAEIWVYYKYGKIGGHAIVSWNTKEEIWQTGNLAILGRDFVTHFQYLPQPPEGKDDESKN